jgi:hypothetical protein
MKGFLRWARKNYFSFAKVITFGKKDSSNIVLLGSGYSEELYLGTID